jgi:menaquinone-9 beta-reductase
MNYNYDLIIVGGGPAGSTMALSAHKHGLKVLLLDKDRFPRDKICGDVISVDAITILQEFQITDKLLQAPHAWTGKHIQIFTEHEHLEIPSRSHVISKRKIFDNVLFQAARSRVDTREGAKVENLLIEDGQVLGVNGSYQTGGSFEYTAKIVAGADGCGSVVAKKLGLYKFDPQNGAVATRASY